MPRRGFAQDGAQKSGNSRSKTAGGFAGLSWCLLVPLAAQQKSTKKMVQDFLGQKNVRNSLLRKVVKFVQDLMPTPRDVSGDSCAVVSRIKFPGRRDLGGALPPEISQLTELESLNLGDTNVSGSLEVLANNTELQFLQLFHTRVTGRLEDLPKAKNLDRLDLTGTEVTGDLAALANATELRYLLLSNTAVSGELKSLAQLNELKQLDLSSTAVSGELKSLAKMTELQKLELANLKVGGDVAVMAEWSKIEHVDLSGTEVEFVRTDFLQKFEPVDLSKRKWNCPWPALRFLDVSRTSRFSQAQDLLRPFAGCGKLATLKAAGCGLSGPLWPEIVNKFGVILSMDRWPLSKALSLSVLDFARNNVTEVAELPGSCRTLVLSGNPHVSFGAGVLQKAIKDIVFIDLRNATFANLSDALLLIGQLAVITHALSIVVPAVTSYAESTSRTDSSQNFQISSERMVCEFVEKSRLIKVGQVRFDTKRCATRF